MKRSGIRALVVTAGVAAAVATGVALRQDTSESPAFPPECLFHILDGRGSV